MVPARTLRQIVVAHAVLTGLVTVVAGCGSRSPLKSDSGFASAGSAGQGATGGVGIGGDASGAFGGGGSKDAGPGSPAQRACGTERDCAFEPELKGCVCSTQKCQCNPGDAGTEAASIGDGSAGAFPACTWPASVDGHDPGACRAARTLLSCDGSNGVSESCISDDPTHCSGESGVSWVCHDFCAPQEYGAVCGSIGGAGPISDPPAGCHGERPTPAGIVFYCCPCL